MESPTNDSTKKINLLKQILLYPQVSAFKLISDIPWLSNYRSWYPVRASSVAMVIFNGVVIIYYLNPYLPLSWLKILIVALGCYGILLDLFWGKTVASVASSYYSYYNKFLFYLFLVFIGLGTSGIIVLFYNSILKFYNSIGHVQ